MNQTVELERLRDKLSKLNNLDGLRDLLADLNYKVENMHIPTSDWGQLSQTAQDGELKIIARHNGFIITHCRLPELRRTVERALVTRLIKQYERGLFIFSDNDFTKWHFVNVKEDTRKSNRLVLRRITIGPEEKLRTATERLAMLKVKSDSWSELQVEERHEEAFDVEKVTKQFYEEYNEKFEKIKISLEEGNKVQSRIAKAFVQQFFNRMMFLYFLQRKGWLGDNREFVSWLWKTYQKKKPSQGNFYTTYLDALFFQALNSPPPKTELQERRDLPDEVKQVFLDLPYLNGGLFSRLEGIDDQGLVIKDDEVSGILEGLLEHYNFTITEDTPFDKEVAVNPEMLGKVYESLVLEEERGQAGIFYTPRVEVDFMCRRSLIEYLDEESIIDRTDLIKVVMNAENSDPDDFESIPKLSEEQWIKIRQRLEEVTVVDPACGSGAFLVGMMQVLCGLHRLICKRLGEEYHDFQVKKRIIGRNLFGVDIKEWAVRVAELRLWLSLIIDASRKEVQEDPKKPILPNLTFRLQMGDSLVEEMAGYNLSLRGRYSHMSKPVKEMVENLVKQKTDFYYNQGEAESYQKIRQKENGFFLAILNERIGKIDSDLHNKRNREREILQHLIDAILSGRRMKGTSENAQLREEIRRLEEERANLDKIRNSIESEQVKRAFLWSIEFAEVFQHKGGFDIVIGNPPYVRQEKIAPLNKDPQNYTSQQWQEEKRHYKEALLRSVETHWGKEVKVGGRADLYVYFYIISLSLLRPGGTFCFITSNSWLDVDFGADLQRFLLTNVEIKDIYDNHAKRSFARSDINTVIVLFRRPQNNEDLSRHMVRFVAFKRPFEEVLTAENLNNIERVNQLLRTDDLRVYPITQGDLWQAGMKLDEEGTGKINFGFGDGDYKGDKWGGKYLRAPDIYYTILEKGKGKLVKLGDIAEVRFGIKTGANEFFYLQTTGLPAPSGSVHVRNGAGWEGLIEAEFLKPIVKSPREIKTILIRIEDLKYRVFMCHLSKEELKKQGKLYALNYIAWGEEQGYHSRPTCASRPRWWDLGVWILSDIILPMFERERKYCFWNQNFYVDAALYWVYCDQLISKIICSMLNSTLFGFWKELMARPPEGGGGGPIQMKVYNYNEMLICDVNKLGYSQHNILEKAFERIISREIKTIFEELGLPKPNRDYSNIHPEDVTLDKVLPDRRALDQVVFEALGLTEEEQLEVYRAVVTLVKERLSKARSVNPNAS